MTPEARAAMEKALERVEAPRFYTLFDILGAAAVAGVRRGGFQRGNKLGAIKRGRKKMALRSTDDCFVVLRAAATEMITKSMVAEDPDKKLLLDTTLALLNVMQNFFHDVRTIANLRR